MLFSSPPAFKAIWILVYPILFLKAAETIVRRERDGLKNCSGCPHMPIFYVLQWRHYEKSIGGPISRQDLKASVLKKLLEGASSNQKNDIIEGCRFLSLFQLPFVQFSHSGETFGLRAKEVLCCAWECLSLCWVTSFQFKKYGHMRESDLNLSILFLHFTQPPHNSLEVSCVELSLNLHAFVGWLEVAFARTF